MKLNRKGYMLVEIILASVLAMSIAFYLLNLTYDFKNKSEDIYQDIVYTTDKIAITKNIMNDLDRGKVISINDPKISINDPETENEKNTKTVDFSIKIDSNIENRRITIEKTQTRTTIYYGKLIGDEYEKKDVSYYEKTIEKSLIVQTPEITKHGDYLELKIPIQSLYTDKNYDINILIECTVMPILQDVPNLEYNEELWGYKENIAEIIFQNKKNPIPGAIEWDVSSIGNESVMAYLVTNESDSSKYTVYIQGKDGVIANPDSDILFANFKNLKKITGLEYLDTTNVTSMMGMFSGCTALKELNLSSFNTSKVVDMSYMFSDCSALKELDLSTFNTVNVTDMSYMFYLCSSLKELDLSTFNTAKVTSMRDMFYGCRSLTKLDLGDNFDTTKVRSTVGMFQDCSSLTKLDLGKKFDTSNVEYMAFMFSRCSSLTELDLGEKFDTSNIKNIDMQSMFSRCSSLTELDLGEKFDTSNVKQMHRMFYDCRSLTKLDLGDKFDTSNVKNMAGMFQGCSSLTELNLGDKFDTSKVETMGGGFSEQYASGDNGMFEGCSSLTKLDLGDNFNTKNVTNMSAMFKGCSALEELDLGEQFYTENVEFMQFMFAGLNNLTELNLGEHFDTSNVENMRYMFYDMNKIETLNLCSFDTSKVTDMTNMFGNFIENNSQLKNVYVGNDWTTANANTDKMFYKSNITNVTKNQCS